MRRSVRFNRMVMAGFAAAVTAAGPIGAAHAEPNGPEVPEKIDVPDGNKVFLVGNTVGVQIYSCTATGSGGHSWTFVGPRADLYGKNGDLITTHFGGPTWRALDGSEVLGQRVDGVTVDPTAIPWLLLSAASTSAGSDGDRLTATTFIQRTATTGGMAPAPAECNAATAGTTEEVAYTADYHFWKQTGR